MSNEVKNKKVINKSRVIILIIVVILTLLVAGLITVNYIKNKSTSDDPNTVVIDDTINEYGYDVTDNATEYYKDLFGKLKTLLSNSEFDEEEYAKLVSLMFVTDFYTLSNKVTNSDIGGYQFIASDYQENFKLAAKSTIYSSVESNVYSDRVQELPNVIKASIDSINTISYKYGDDKDNNAYEVKVSITYEKELGYPDSVELILIHNDKKIEIAKID